MQQSNVAQFNVNKKISWLKRRPVVRIHLKPWCSKRS